MNYPIIYRVLTIPGGAGFCPSTVWYDKIWYCTYITIVPIQPYHPHARLLMCTEPTEQKLSAVFMGVSSWGFGGTNVGGQNGGKLWAWDVGAAVGEIWCCFSFVCVEFGSCYNLMGMFPLRFCKKILFCSGPHALLWWSGRGGILCMGLWWCFATISNLPVGRASRENLSFSVVCFIEFLALKMCFNDPTWLFLLVLSGLEIPLFPTVLVGILQCRLSQLLSDARKSAFLQSLHHKSWDHGLEAKKSRRNWMIEWCGWMEDEKNKGLSWQMNGWYEMWKDGLVMNCCTV